MKKILILAALICGIWIMSRCGSSSNNDNSSEVEVEEETNYVNETTEEEMSTKQRIEKALNMEDWDEANSQIEKMIENGEQDLALFEKVWKTEARYIIKKNDFESFCNLSDVMSMYNIKSIPIVDRQFFMRYATEWKRDPHFEIYRSGKEYQDEVIRFNAIVDDIVDMALMRSKKQIAKKCLILYRKDIELKESSKMEPSSFCSNDHKAEWKYSEKSKDEAKKRIANDNETQQNDVKANDSIAGIF